MPALTMRIPSSPDSSSRRGFLKLFVLASSALSAAIISVPVVGALLTPLLRRKKGPDSPFLFAAALADLPAGVPVRVDLVSTVVDGWSRSRGVVGAAWVLKQRDGSVSALSTVCPHSGCSINAAADLKAFSCPCHASAFALDGKPTTGPSPRAMDPLEVEVHDKQVFLRYARFQQGTPSRVEL